MQPLLSRSELCTLVPRRRLLLLLGDSLLSQVGQAWQARVGYSAGVQPSGEVCARGALVTCREGGAVQWAAAPFIASGHVGRWQELPESEREAGKQPRKPPYRGMENRLWVLTTERHPITTSDFTTSDANGSTCESEVGICEPCSARLHRWAREYTHTRARTHTHNTHTHTHTRYSTNTRATRALTHLLTRAHARYSRTLTHS